MVRSGSQDESVESDRTHEFEDRRAQTRWNLGCAITCFSPVAAACASLLLMWLFGDHPMGWVVAIIIINAFVAAAGSASGPMLLHEQLPSKVVGAVLSAVGGLIAYAVLFIIFIIGAIFTAGLR